MFTSLRRPQPLSGPPWSRRGETRLRSGWRINSATTDVRPGRVFDGRRRRIGRHAFRRRSPERPLMFVQNPCTFCGVALPAPHHLVRTGERCPACMVSAENARQSPVGVPAWNAPLPHDIYSVDASTQRQGVRVVRSEWTVRVGVQFPCQYCREHHNETKTLTVTFPVEPAMSEINQWVRNKLGEADWKESEGVLCPKCLHFAP